MATHVAKLGGHWVFPITVVAENNKPLSIEGATIEMIVSNSSGRVLTLTSGGGIEHISAGEGRAQAVIAPPHTGFVIGTKYKYEVWITFANGIREFFGDGVIEVQQSVRNQYP